MDSNYQTLPPSPGNGYEADLHDFQIARQRGLPHRLQPDPLRPLLGGRGAQRGAGRHGGPGGRHEDRLVRSEWHSVDHVATSESHTPSPRRPCVGLLPPELDRARAGRGSADLRPQHLATYRLQSGSGTILWRLGGTRRASRCLREPKWPGSTTPSAADGTITLFDDGSNPRVHYQSRGIRVQIDTGRHTAG